MTYTPVYTSTTSVYSKTGLSASECDLSANDEIIADAEAELEQITGRKFTSGNAITEYFSTKDKDIIDQYKTVVQLTHYPIQSVTEFKILDMDGNATSTFETLTSVQIAAGTLQTDDYWLQVMNDATNNAIIPNGKINLKTVTIPKGTNNVKVSYTYGFSTVPTSIRDLATCLAGIRAWIRFMGGNYGALNSYSIPQQSVDKGDFYSRGKMNIDLLTEEANRILDRVGRKPRVLGFSTGSVR